MRKIFAGATVVLLTAGAASTASAQLNLRGSDTLEDVAKEVIADCVTSGAIPAAPAVGSITYGGGGSGTGQSAMLAIPPTQHIAPMSRPFNGALCVGGTPTTQGVLDVNAEQLLIGLDGIAVVGANQTGEGGNLSSDVGFFQCADSVLPTGVCSNNPAIQCNVLSATADCGAGNTCIASRVCSNNAAIPCSAATVAADCGAGNTCVAISGLNGRPVTVNLPAGTPDCTMDGCVGAVPNQTYTFNNWKEVLAMIYGGQNNAKNVCSGDLTTRCTTATQAVDCATAGGTCVGPLTPAFPKSRIKARINCASPVRKALADNWGTLFLLPHNCGYGPLAGDCVKLKHAFRRADSSGTTDTFVTLTGMVAIPASSKVVCGTAPNAAIEGVDATSATANPFCNAGTAPMNKGGSDYLDLDPIRRIADSDIAPRPGLEQVAECGVAPSNPPAVRWLDTRPDPTLVPVELPEDAGFHNNYGPNLCDINPPNIPGWAVKESADLILRKGLGLVLPIEIPTNYVDENQAYWGAGLPVLCTPGAFAPSLVAPLVAGQGVMCPNGTQFGVCVLPVALNPNPLLPPNFNCMSETAVPAKICKDERYYNTVVVNSSGKLQFDNYCNPNVGIPCAGAINRQARPVTAWYRLHVSRATNLGGNNLIGSIPPAAPVNTCKTFSATDQIGCLVKANPCSIGFAGREAVDKLANGVPKNFAYRLGGDVAGTVGAVFVPTPPTDNHVVDLLDPLATSFYPMSRKLFVNRYVNPASQEVSLPNFNSEEALYTCFKNPAFTNAAISHFNFLQVPTGPTVDNVCPNNR